MVITSCTDCSIEDVDAAVVSCHQAFQSFSKFKPRQRSDLLTRWAQKITENLDDLCLVLTYETGKPLIESRGEFAYALSFNKWFAGEAERISGLVMQQAELPRKILTMKQPIGVVAALVPWNYPVAMLLRKACAALAAGCTVLAKPSPETPLTTLALASLAIQAGYPKGCFNVITTSLENTPSVAKAICEHPLVKKITFTGSSAVGKLIATYAAQGLKKVTLELGGNCPYIVFDDANLEQAADALIRLKWGNAGQACVSANRIYVQDGIYEAFTQLFATKTAQLRVGHGADDGINIGAMATSRGVAKAAKHVGDAVQKGAKVLLEGGADSTSKGFFFKPVILTNVNASMLVASEETFGPVASFFKFHTEKEAIQLANQTNMGLASYFFTKDADRIWRLYAALEAGMIGINTGKSVVVHEHFFLEC